MICNWRLGRELLKSGPTKTEPEIYGAQKRLRASTHARSQRFVTTASCQTSSQSQKCLPSQHYGANRLSRSDLWLVSKSSAATGMRLAAVFSTLRATSPWGVRATWTSPSMRHSAFLLLLIRKIHPVSPAYSPKQPVHRIQLPRVRQAPNERCFQSKHGRAGASQGARACPAGP